MDSLQSLRLFYEFKRRNIHEIFLVYLTRIYSHLPTFRMRVGSAFKISEPITLLWSSQLVHSVICDRMQVVCRILEHWFRKGSLLDNPVKTELILFTHKRIIVNFAAPRIYGKPLASVCKAKYSGVVLGCKLQWRTHIQAVRSKSINLGFFTKNSAPTRYGSHIRLRIQYGAIVCWPAAVSRKTVKSTLCKIMGPEILICIDIIAAQWKPRPQPL